MEQQHDTSHRRDAHQITISVSVPYTGSHAHGAADALIEAMRRSLSKHAPEGVATANAEISATVDAADPVVLAMEVIGPGQINMLDDIHCTVTYPAGSATVASVQPGTGKVETRPEGTQGPYEIALKGTDRLVFAPTGPTGHTYLMAYADTVPNG